MVGRVLIAVAILTHTAQPDSRRSRNRPINHRKEGRKRYRISGGGIMTNTDELEKDRRYAPTSSSGATIACGSIRKARWLPRRGSGHSTAQAPGGLIGPVARGYGRFVK